MNSILETMLEKYHPEIKMRCTPNPGQGGGVFISKFTLEYKLECIEKFKNFRVILTPEDYLKYRN